MKENNMKKKLLFLLISSCAFAEVIGGPEILNKSSDTPMQTTKSTGEVSVNNPPNLAFPIDNKLKNKTPQIKLKEFQLTIDPNAVKEVRKGKQKYENLMRHTEIDYLIAPEQRILKDVDVISVHPQFISTLTFPSQIKILSAQSSTPMNLMQFKQNVLLLQPDASFGYGNVFITYQSETKNYSMNLLIKNYDEREGALKIAYQYSWDDDAKIDYVGVLKHYLALNGDKSLKTLKKDGDHDVIVLNNITYYIIRDSINGNIDYGNQRFNISTRYEFSNKSAKDKRSSNDLFPVGNLKSKQ